MASISSRSSSPPASFREAAPPGLGAGRAAWAVCWPPFVTAGLALGFWAAGRSRGAPSSWSWRGFAPGRKRATAINRIPRPPMPAPQLIVFVHPVRSTQAIRLSTPLTSRSDIPVRKSPSGSSAKPIPASRVRGLRPWANNPAVMATMTVMTAMVTNSDVPMCSSIPHSWVRRWEGLVKLVSRSLMFSRWDGPAPPGWRHSTMHRGTRSDSGTDAQRWVDASEETCHESEHLASPRKEPRAQVPQGVPCQHSSPTSKAPAEPMGQNPPPIPHASAR